MKKMCVVLIVLISILACEDSSSDSDSSSSAKTTDVRLKSSALAARELTTGGTDWKREHDHLFAKVTGVRGKIRKLILSGESDPPAMWTLFSGKEAEFDLSSLETLLSVDTDETVLDQAGELNTISLYISYLDIDISFKSETATLRLYWEDDSEVGSKKGDILVKDGTAYKWMKLDDRTLTDARPADANTVKVNSANVLNASGTESNIFPFVLDNFSNADYIKDDSPWNTFQGDAGRLDSYYTISNDSLEKGLVITLDLSLESAAQFYPYAKEEPTPGADDVFVYTSEPYFDIEWDYDGNGTADGNYQEGAEVLNIKDLDGNTVDSAEFTIADILPGLTYPDIHINVQVEEK